MSGPMRRREPGGGGEAGMDSMDVSIQLVNSKLNIEITALGQ